MKNFKVLLILVPLLTVVLSGTSDKTGTVHRRLAPSPRKDDMHVPLNSPLFTVGHAVGNNICPTSFCGSITLDYPFKLSGSQPQNLCNYINLTCNITLDLGTPILDLPHAGEFYIRYIDYYASYIQLHDPGSCLMGRLMKNLNLSSSLFKAKEYENYTFYLCPSNSYFRDIDVVPIHCLSNQTNSTVATSMIAQELMIESGCVVIGSWLLPVLEPGQFEFDGTNGDLYLTWNSTTCKDCEEAKTDTGRKSFHWSTTLEYQVCNCCPLRTKKLYILIPKGFGSTYVVSSPLLCILILTCMLTSFRLLAVLCLKSVYNCIAGGSTSKVDNSWAKFAESHFFVPFFTGMAFVIVITTLNILKYATRNDLNNDPHAADGWLESSTAPPRSIAGGLDESRINTCTELVVLSENRVNSGLDDCNSTTCAICLENYQPLEIIRNIAKCEHCFHAECIEMWLRKNGTCPVCRTSLAQHQL